MTPEAARKLYDETVKGVAAEQEVRARHILVENEDEAKKAYARVKGGEDFAKVAGELSKDPGSKTDGGDLGFFTKDRMVRALCRGRLQARARPDLRAGEEPVRLARDQGRGKAQQAGPAFEETKDQVETYLGRKAQQDVIVGPAQERQGRAPGRQGQPRRAEAAEAAIRRTCKAPRAPDGSHIDRRPSRHASASMAGAAPANDAPRFADISSADSFRIATGPSSVRLA